MDIDFDLLSLRRIYRDGVCTPREVLAEVLRRIAAYPDPAVWISRVAQADLEARVAALEADPRARELPLYGIPFAVKDNIDVVGVPTTAGCPAFAYRPEHSAPVIERLMAAGAICVGKTNLDQFATGLVGTRSPYGAPACVFDSRYISGGSSSGSAVAVAAGLVSFALGTDTAGSGRVPAAFNNIVGLKPTRGLLGTRGVVPACRSLDCVSIFAGSVASAAEIFEIAHAFDESDPFSRPFTPRSLPHGSFRFGVLSSADLKIAPDLEALYREAADRLCSLDGQAVEIDFAPFAETAQLLYGGPWVAERHAAIKSFFAVHARDMDPTVRTIITGAETVSATDAFEGHYRLAALARAAEAQWRRMDVLLLPTAPTQFSFEDIAADPIGRNAELGRFTNFVNLLDGCAIALPAGFRSNGLAFGVTLVAPAFEDRAVFRLADRLQRARSFGIGRDRGRALPPDDRRAPSVPDGFVPLFVVGAHLSGMPLNHELRDAGAIFVRETATSPDYRLFVLPKSIPPKPGLLRSSGVIGPGIAGEVWALSPEAFGRFVSRIPAPLGIGKISLADGSSVSGFLCEACALADAEEITELGGWRRYMAARGAAAQ